MERMPCGQFEANALFFAVGVLAYNPYKLFGMVSNMDWEGETPIHWQRKRCGVSEQARPVMKEDLAGGTLPSGKFGVNAA